MREIMKIYIYLNLRFEPRSNFNIITSPQRFIILFNLKSTYNTEINAEEYFKAITNFKQICINQNIKPFSTIRLEELNFLTCYERIRTMFR